MSRPRPRWVPLGLILALIAATGCAHSRESFSFLKKSGPVAVAPKPGKLAAKAPARKASAEADRVGLDDDRVD